MTPEDNLHKELKERLRFETLIADLSSKFVNVPASKVESKIVDAQRLACALLGLDFSVLGQLSDQSSGLFTATHFYSAKESPQFSDRMTQDQFPLARQRLLAGCLIKISSPEDLPAEAARDRETLRQFGIKSNLALPLAAGGEPALQASKLMMRGYRRVLKRPLESRPHRDMAGKAKLQFTSQEVHK